MYFFSYTENSVARPWRFTLYLCWLTKDKKNQQKVSMQAYDNNESNIMISELGNLCFELITLFKNINDCWSVLILEWAIPMGQNWFLAYFFSQWFYDRFQFIKLKLHLKFSKCVAQFTAVVYECVYWGFFVNPLYPFMCKHQAQSHRLLG